MTTPLSHNCSTCSEPVDSGEKAFQCDFCEKWEHLQCVREADRPSEQVYVAMAACPVKCVMYCCSRCRSKGSIDKRMVKLELESARANEARLASERLLDERQITVDSLLRERDELAREKADLVKELRALKRSITWSGREPKTEGETESPSPVTPRESVREDATVTTTAPRETVRERTDAVEGGDSETEEARSKTGRPHPPGFRELRERVGKFSGKKGDNDFCLWMADFEEASQDCKWTDELRARWFSWFVEGPAKATWQQTLTTEEKGSWSSIKKIYQAQFGIHMDPQTAYRRCHELQYSDFGSVQGLLESMREYQRMAPSKLSDANLESILWNKVPYVMQREVGEMKEWTLNELFQRLLKAESRVLERERRQPGTTSKVVDRQEEVKKTSPSRQGSPGTGNSQPRRGRTHPRPPTRNTAEARLQCFNCKELGHKASACPKPPRKATANVVTTNESDADQDLWSLVLSVDGKEKCGNKGKSMLVGPTYKIEITVEGVRTRALLDHGAQVTIVRRQLLGKVKEKHEWPVETCRSKEIPLDKQPIGATGTELGAIGAVKLNMEVAATKANREISCFVLDSRKPLWQGQLRDCGVLLGTNALVEFGIEVSHSDGTVIRPSSQNTPEGTQDSQKDDKVKTSEGTRGSQEDDKVKTVKTPEGTQGSQEDKVRILQLSMKKTVHLMPQQSKWVKATVDLPEDISESKLVGVMSPKADTLGGMNCDFVEGLWSGETTVLIPLNNWGTGSIWVTKGTIVGQVEGADLVEKGDPLWRRQADMDQTVRKCTVSREQGTRRNELRPKLQIGDAGSGTEQDRLLEILLEHNEAFALNDLELGETDVVQHSINTAGAPPVKTSPRRIPYTLRKELEDELENLLESGCIEPSRSPYSSALVLVRKKGGGLRVCVDYRALNKDTVPDRFPIPRIDEVVDMVGRCKATVFSALDLMKGYHQVEMKEEDKEKTAFLCPNGLFQYRRMPFGLTNAPATFQRLMTSVFAGREWPFVFIYLDDILIASNSMEDHIGHVAKVLNKLMDAGLRLKPSKCVFAQREINYLGFTLTGKGVKPNDAKVKAVKEFPKPKSAKEVKSFLGLVNFYRRHVKDLGITARPLTELTRKDKTTGNAVKFVWTAKCDEAFEEIKTKLTSAPILQPPDLNKEFFLWTDASQVGFGAVLEQENSDGVRLPIAFASRPTNQAEAKYGVTELEVAALIFALEHFEVYLLGNSVTVFTDHQALVKSYLPYLKSQVKGILARWYLRLARFLPNLKLEYKPGSTNTVADTLSRAPVRVNQVIEEPQQDTVLSAVQEKQRDDEELKLIIDYLESKSLPDDREKARKVLDQAHRGYFLVDGILYHEDSSSSPRRQLVVPEKLRNQVLEEGHDATYAGHFAPKKLYKRVSQHYYWPKMRGDIYQKCQFCVTCASAQGQKRRQTPPLQSIPVGEPFECLGMDFKEMDTSHQGNRYALVLQDYLTKWPEVFAVPDRTASTVAKCLCELVWRHGVPRKIIHDRAPEFLSNLLQDTAELMGVQQLPTAGGHPQTDGLVERFNRTLKNMLCKLVEKKGKNWDTLLGPVLFAYRTTPHDSTGESPFFLMHGRDAKLPTALDFYTPLSGCPTVETDYARELYKELKSAREIAQKNIKKAQVSQKTQYDKKTKNCDILPGDLVMLKSEPRFKLDRNYKGPYRVTEVTATNGIVKALNTTEKDTIIVPLQRLSKCHQQFPQDAVPWTGHSKSRKRRAIRGKAHQDSKQEGANAEPNRDSHNSASNDTPEVPKKTRSGRKVTLPQRYRVNCISWPSGPAYSGGGSCKGRSRERGAGRVT